MATRATKTGEYQTPPKLMVASALHLLSQLPQNEWAHGLRVIVESLRGLYGEPKPEWLQMLVDLAERESAHQSSA